MNLYDYFSTLLLYILALYNILYASVVKMNMIV